MAFDSNLRPTVMIADVMQATVELTGFSADTLRSNKRNADLAEARQFLMHVAKVSTGKSFPQIGRALNRDHTTIMYGVRKVAQLVKKDVLFALVCEAIRDRAEEIYYHRNGGMTKTETPFATIYGVPASAFPKTGIFKAIQQKIKQEAHCG